MPGGPGEGATVVSQKLARRVLKRVPLPGGRLVRSAALPTAVHLAPSVLVLGQWWPSFAPGLRALPGGLCRWRGPATGRPEVSLTFDDGPDPEGSLAVADRLEDAGMRGTFFLLGERVDEHPDVVRELRRRGHEIGTHGYRHSRHLLRGGNAIAADLKLALTSLKRLGPEFHPRYFRPPYGQVSGGSLIAAQRAGLELVLWSAWGREWAEERAAAVAARVDRRLERGAIVLLHDSDATSPPGTALRARQALGTILQHLESRGLRSVTLSELVKP